MPLATVETGKNVRLIAINGGQEVKNRLFSLGLIPGARIEVLQNTSRGPFLLAVKGSRIMLGRGMARKIVVE
ncbi:MAG: ferrous iron transport protein A [bacterium]